MSKQKLTAKFVESLRPPATGRTYVWDTYPDGFGVCVTDKGAKSWILYRRWPPANVPARRRIGDADELPLTDARAKAAEWVELIARGIDPKRKEEQDRLAEIQKLDTTFAAVAEAFIAQKLARERKGAEVEQDIRRDLLPHWGRRPITEITDLDIHAVVMAKHKSAPTQARNLLGIIKRLLQWTVEQRVYGLKANAAMLLRPKSLFGKKRKRERALNQDEMRALWRAARKEGYPCGDVYKLLALCALRLNEAARARWQEFPLAVIRALRQRKPGERIDWARLSNEPLMWVIPAERMKGKDEDARDHAVPLTAEILEVLESLPVFKSGDYLFSNSFGRKPAWISEKVKKRMDRRMLRTLRALARLRGDDPAAVELRAWVNHDIRRTVRTGLSRLKISERAREAVLAHVPEGIKRVYDVHDYADEKREALELWAARLKTIVEPPRPADNVVRLEARK